jgi:hypothetical protein
MVQLDKPDCPVSPALMAVKGTIGSSEGILLPVKWHLARKENEIHDNSRSCGGG